ARRAGPAEPRPAAARRDASLRRARLLRDQRGRRLPRRRRGEDRALLALRQQGRAPRCGPRGDGDRVDPGRRRHGVPDRRSAGAAPARDRRHARSDREPSRAAPYPARDDARADARQPRDARGAAARLRSRTRRPRGRPRRGDRHATGRAGGGRGDRPRGRRRHLPPAPAPPGPGRARSAVRRARARDRVPREHGRRRGASRGGVGVAGGGRRAREIESGRRSIMSSTKLAASTVAPRTLALDEEVEISTRAAQEEAYERLLRRLSHQSVVKHFDAYADVDWEAPEMRIEVGDPHWQLDADDPLGATEWYRSRDPRVRSAIGLHMVATFMKIGLQFESVLKRGLLEFAWRLPNGAPEFRYVYH